MLALLQFLDPETERIEPKGFPAATGIRGLTKLQAQFFQGRDTWLKGVGSPEEFVVIENRIVVLVKIRVKHQKLKH